MKVVQILPELNAGGVERGTLEIADHLVRNGHEALVISNGGRMVSALEKLGARHVTMPVHRKSLLSLMQVRRLRRLLEKERPDILHIRSRVPGWIAYLAWRGMNPQTRPRLVSTVHGFYSVNRYSAIMTKGERVIAVSNSIRDYICQSYPSTNPEIIRVIHRGVAPKDFSHGYQPSAEWLNKWQTEYPQLAGKKILLLPGRITRWKGQEDFIRLIAALRAVATDAHGLIAGETHKKKRGFLTELRQLAAKLGVGDSVTFLGHRNDLREIMAISDIVYSLSRDPEAFGRVSLEAMGISRPVIAFNHGGVAEQLTTLFPKGLIPLGNTAQLLNTSIDLLHHPAKPAKVGVPFTLEAMTSATLSVYRELLGACPPHSPDLL
jgi:glycosyltransferase involved in cell wall biosynthesis